jgi:hypothetical protein
MVRRCFLVLGLLNCCFTILVFVVAGRILDLEYRVCLKRKMNERGSENKLIHNKRNIVLERKRSESIEQTKPKMKSSITC